MSFKSWLSIITLLLVAVIVFFSRGELVHAWNLLGTVNIWILLLLIPAQIFVYYVGGEMMFSYLRSKGAIEHVSVKDQTQMALEMNFVNHVLPSGGVSGISYMSWRLGKYGISPGRATMAQLVRFAMAFVAYLVLVIVGVIAITIDGSINRWILFASFSVVLGSFILGVGAVYVLSSRHRMWKFADLVVRRGNRFVRRITFGRKKRVFQYKEVERFFTDMHFDFEALRRDRKLLIKPLLWGFVFTLGDVLLFLITFWSMGIVFNPAPLLIAYGLAIIVSMVVITPGGAGAYEAVMIGFLAMAGVTQSQAIAGVVLTRVILLLGTILLGYVFYQRSILKYGKQEDTPTQRQ